MKAPLRTLSALLRHELATGTGMGGVYFSQFGEDVVLWNFLNSTWNGVYVDVGAHDPHRFSNTHLLHRYRHWRGVNVDLDERAVERLRRARPGDVNLHAAVSDREEDVEVVRFADGAVNTFDPAAAERMAGKFEVEGRVTMRTVTLASLLEAHLPAGQPIDLLTVDVEGVEERVLRGHDWERRAPRFVAVERHAFPAGEPERDSVFLLLRELGYVLVSHLVVTSIYRRR